jgi:hypothetical protein
MCPLDHANSGGKNEERVLGEPSGTGGGRQYGGGTRTAGRPRAESRRPEGVAARNWIADALGHPERMCAPTRRFLLASTVIQSFRLSGVSIEAKARIGRRRPASDEATALRLAKILVGGQVEPDGFFKERSDTEGAYGGVLDVRLDGPERPERHVASGAHSNQAEPPHESNPQPSKSSQRRHVILTET